MAIIKNVSIGQWRGCAFIQIGTTCVVLFELPGEMSVGIEIMTPERVFALRPVKFLTWRR
jgi:hypothetical protein